MRSRLMRFFPVLVAVLVFGATEVYAQTGTVVTRSGQRIRGQIVSMGDNGSESSYGYGNFGNYGDADYLDYSDSVVVRVNGREREIPIEDVKLIDFAGNGTVSQAELNRASQSYDGLVVLRNGRSLAGRVVNVSSNQAVVSTQSGDRSIPLNQVARVYFGTDNTANNDPYYNNNPNPNVYGNYDPRYGQPVQNGQYGQYGQPAYGAARTVTVPTNEAWTNSGIDVRRGDVIHFRASGSVTLSQNGGDYSTPAGANDGRMAGNSPLRGVTGGLLIGRIGNGQPFAIGAESDIAMPANGRLYFGVNDDDVRDNSGNYFVEMFPR